MTHASQRVTTAGAHRVIRADATAMPLPDACIDAIICDPPYGIEFGNLAWDTFKADPTGRVRPFPQGSKEGRQQGHAFQAWTTAWAIEALRVLKPGGWLVAFGAARAYHRLACGVEDAGFECRDFIGWIYACVSEDTEILTEDGWVRYNRARQGQRAVAFSLDTGALQWEPIEAVHVFNHAGPMVRLVSGQTDQLLTLNHRVVTNGNQEIPIPSEQDLQSLFSQLPGDGSLPIGTKEDVLAGLRRTANIGAAERPDHATGVEGGTLDCMRGVRQTDMEAERMDTEGQKSNMLESLQWQAESEESELPSESTSPLEPSAQNSSQQRNEGRTKLGVEGRRYHFQEARELLGRQIRQSPEVGNQDGEGGRLRDGASLADGGTLRLSAQADGGCPSRESSTDGQSADQPDALARQQFSQALGTRQDQDWRSLPSTAVTASQEEYRGVVWCVTIASGAFVARRNGLIFVTGNSGFPKSLSADKAIDRHLGAERVKVRIPAKEACNPSAPGRGQVDYSVNGRPWMLEAQRVGYYETWGDEPATPEAARWRGWGTALRPSIEPAIVARKPLPGTVAENLLKYGTGAINVDAGRLPDDERCSGWSKSGSPSYRGVGGTDSFAIRERPPKDESNGRWPPNVVCVGPELGTESVYYDIRNIFPTPKPSSKERRAGKRFPTVKPIQLMRWLVRLFSAPGSVVLDPFTGSGSTGLACAAEGRLYIGMDKDPKSLATTLARLAYADDMDDDDKPVHHQTKLPGMSV